MARTGRAAVPSRYQDAFSHFILCLMFFRSGWTDVPLSPKGVEEAKSLGQELTQRWESTIDACFTSTLQRAQMTAHYCYWAFAELPNNRDIKRFVMDYRLNERHYGSLQGFSKEKVEKGVYGHGSSTVKLWRRSWYAVPPLLSEDDSRRKHEVTRFKEMCGGQESRVPRGESLGQVAKNRIQPFIDEVLTPTLNSSAGDGGGTGLIVAHANSLRALIGAFVDVEKDPVALRTLERLRIPTGAPLVLKYQSLPDGSTRICDLDGVPIQDRDDGSSSEDPHRDLPDLPDLPVWPLGCVPKKR